MPKTPWAKGTFNPRQQLLLPRINLLMLLKYIHRAAAGFCLVLVCFLRAFHHQESRQQGCCERCSAVTQLSSVSSDCSAGSQTGFRATAGKPWGTVPPVSSFSLERGGSRWSLMGRMHMPFEQAAKPCQALQAGKDEGSTWAGAGGTPCPSPSVSGAHRAEDRVELLCQAQGAVDALL